jgi:hypothetical protein
MDLVPSSWGAGTVSMMKWRTADQMMIKKCI